MNATETELQELLNFFKTAKLPQVPLKLNKYMTVENDVQRFIDSETRAIKDYRGSELVHSSLLKHLRELKAIVEMNSVAN